MTTESILSLVRVILDVLFVSGGLVLLVTLRSTIKTSKANAQGAATDANDKLMQSYEQHILQPIMKEAENARQREENARQREEKQAKLYERTNQKIDRLTMAIEQIPSCQYAAQCPVACFLQKSADCGDRNENGEGTGS